MERQSGSGEKEVGEEVVVSTGHPVGSDCYGVEEYIENGRVQLFIAHNQQQKVRMQLWNQVQGVRECALRVHEKKYYIVD